MSPSAKETPPVPIVIDLEATTASAPFPAIYGTDVDASALATDYAHTLPGWIEARCSVSGMTVSGLDPKGLITITHRVGKVVSLEDDEVIKIYQVGWQWLAGMKSCVEGGYHALPQRLLGLLRPGQVLTNGALKEEFKKAAREEESVAWMRMILNAVAAVARSQAVSK